MIRLSTTQNLSLHCRILLASHCQAICLPAPRRGTFVSLVDGRAPGLNSCRPLGQPVVHRRSNPILACFQPM